jgi:hypothetical protein
MRRGGSHWPKLLASDNGGMKYRQYAWPPAFPLGIHQEEKSAMANQAQHPPVIDPDSIPEIICDGQFNVSTSGDLATLTFTHARPDASAMFGAGTVNPSAVVRARIVITLGSLAALRDLLNRVIQAPDTPAPPAGGPTRH